MRLANKVTLDAPYELEIGSASFDRFLNSSAAITTHALQWSREAQNLICEKLRVILGESRCRELLEETQNPANGIVVLYGPEAAGSTEGMTKLLTALSGILGDWYPELGEGGGMIRMIESTHRDLDPQDTIGASDFYRNPYTVFRLRTDGCHHQPPPDWVALGKISPDTGLGGESLVLRLSEFSELERFRSDPRAAVPVRWLAPGHFSEKIIQSLHRQGVQTEVSQPVFGHDALGDTIRFVRRGPTNPGFQCSLPMIQYLAGLDEALHGSPSIQTIELPVGAVLITNNLRVLHGRAAFQVRRGFERRVLRLRGRFNDER